MNYLQYWIKLWPSPDKPQLIWGEERGVLYKDQYEPCFDHLEGLIVICELVMPKNDWEGRTRWIEYLTKLKKYTEK